MQLDELVILVKDFALLHPSSSIECIIDYVLSNAVRFDERDSTRALLYEAFSVKQSKKTVLKESKTDIDCIVDQFVKIEPKKRQE